MPVGVYIASTTEFSGKSVVAAGLGLRLMKDDVRVGFMKPVGVSPCADGKPGDDDAVFMQSVLQLDEDPTLASPVVIDDDFRKNALKSPPEDAMPQIKAAYEELSQGKDLMLVNGAHAIHSGRFMNLDGFRILEELDLKLLLIDRMRAEPNSDYVAMIKDRVGERLIGVLLNDVPMNLMMEVQELIKPFLQRNGVDVLGVIPKDPLLGGIRLGELAKRLGGKIITAHDRTERIVENFLIGAMQVDNFLTFYRKNKNSVVIMGGDRSDLQLVCIEGEGPGLILTGNLYPNDVILTRSEILRVPIMLVPGDTYSVAKTVEDIMSNQKVRDMIKLRHGAQRVISSLDYEKLKKMLV